jgi:predicted enzyme related to lactoylglutathione lyase
MENTQIRSISMGSVYTDDYAKSFEFYNDILGLTDYNPMGNQACYFNIGEHQGLYLEGGHIPYESNIKTARTTFTLDVISAFEMFEKLKDAGVKIVQSEPMKMQEGSYWFQCYDPSGNIVEFLGGE